jgi:hypothetical protein
MGRRRPRVSFGSEAERLTARILSPVCIRKPTLDAFDLSVHDGHRQQLMLPAETRDLLAAAVSAGLTLLLFAWPCVLKHIEQRWLGL